MPHRPCNEGSAGGERLCTVLSRAPLSYAHSLDPSLKINFLNDAKMFCFSERTPSIPLCECLFSPAPFCAVCLGHLCAVGWCTAVWVGASCRGGLPMRTLCWKCCSPALWGLVVVVKMRVRGPGVCNGGTEIVRALFHPCRLLSQWLPWGRATRAKNPTKARSRL